MVKTKTTQPLNQDNRDIFGIFQSLEKIESMIQFLPEDQKTDFLGYIDELKIKLSNLGNSKNTGEINLIIKKLQEIIKKRVHNQVASHEISSEESLRKQIEATKTIQSLKDQLHLLEEQIQFYEKKTESLSTRLNFKIAIESVIRCETHDDLFDVIESLSEKIHLEETHFIITKNIGLDHNEPYIANLMNRLENNSRKRIIYNTVSFGPQFDVHHGKLTIPVAHTYQHSSQEQTVDNKKVIGILALSFKKGSIEDKKKPEIEMLISAIQHVLEVLGEKNILKNLKEEVHTDQLTGIHNRKMIDGKLPAFVLQAKENQKPIGFLFFDLNGFKEINDTYGHLVGDTMIQSFALHLKTFIQKYYPDAIIARQGGDEFQVILPNISIEQLQALTDDFYHFLETQSCLIKHDGEILELKIKTSIGGTLWNPIDSEIDISANIKDFILQADANLYKAKDKKGTGNPTIFLSQI